MQPREIQEIIAFILNIAGDDRIAGIIGLCWIDRNLIVIAAQAGDKTQLVGRSLVKDERRESAQSGSLIVDNLRYRRFEAEISSVAGETSVVRKALPMISKADLVIRVVVATIAGDEFRLMVALKPGPCHHVKNTIRPVAILGIESAALHFDVVDILRIELWANI